MADEESKIKIDARGIIEKSKTYEQYVAEN
jgi:hypothetical protein